MASSVLTITCLLIAGLTGSAHGSAFRGAGPTTSMGHMRVADLRAAMLDELMAALGSGNRVTQQRLEKIEEALRPTFMSLPKNAHGHLEHSTVRYALHRLFVLRHGMYVKGLEPGGEGWNGTASPTEVLDDKVPEYVQTMFEKRLDGRGLGMHEIAILAATLEHLIHDEAVDRLKAAYSVHNLAVESRLSMTELDNVIDTYMVFFLLGKNASETSLEDIQAEQADILSVYPAWPESQKFTRDVQNSVLTANSGSTDFADRRISFNGAAQIVEEIGERYGRWQDSECHDLKGALMKLEEPGTGRVLLKNFYNNALDGAWQFTESVAYLKELGALDETDPERKSVIIPNYINSPSNCLASSSVYSVCCLNECEGLLGHLEREIGEPDAAVQRVIDLVTNLASTTVQAPRSISSKLRGLLEEVASHHNGKVPLHGRLFGQWMHIAYPRECPYPHKSGTTKPMSADEWMDEKGVDALSASDEEMQYHVTSPPSVDGSNDEKPQLMWTTDEELVVMTTAAPGRNRGWSFLGSSAFYAGVVSLLLTIVRIYNPSLWRGLSSGKDMLPTCQKSHYC